MKKSPKPLGALLAAAAGYATTHVLAAGPSGTDSVSELALTGNQLLMLFGGATLLGAAIWLVIRLLNRE
jgi:hypothetical protein